MATATTPDSQPEPRGDEPWAERSTRRWQSDLRAANNVVACTSLADRIEALLPPEDSGAPIPPDSRTKSEHARTDAEQST